MPVDASSDISSTVADLRRPAAYPHTVNDVGFLETHISLLFFAGERVYKVKKSVNLGFLDFTSLERRHHFCTEEVRLNRRLAPSVYLGVVPITRASDGHLRVGGEGQPVEWAVEMIRLPEGRMFSSLLERGEVDNEQMNSLAALLAAFHAACPTGADVDEYGSLESITSNVEENLELLSEFVRSAPSPSGSQPHPGSSSGPVGLQVLSARQLEFLLGVRRAYLESQRSLFERRVREHRIRDGHGDLHAGNICLTADGVVAYDCIEFSRRFRCGDVAADLAFLAMDIDYRGYPAFSKYLVRSYANLANDPEVPALVPFYKSYRAVVRGKVAALTARGTTIPDVREKLRREAMRYLQLACAYELPPAMLLMCGLPACGKSWMAKRLARSLRAAVLRSDVRRKTLGGIAPTTHVHDEYGAGLYTPESKARTYRSLLADALDQLRSGHSVIVDATFSQRDNRSSFVDAAERLGLPYYIVHVTASDDVIRERLEQRRHASREPSDADLAVYLRARESFEAPTEVPQRHLLEVTSGAGAPEEQSSVVVDRMIALAQGNRPLRPPSASPGDGE